MHLPGWADDDRRQDQGHRLRRRLRHRHRERRRRRVLNVDPAVTLAGPSPVAEGSTHTYSYTTTDDGAPETFSRDAQSCDGGTLSADTFNPVDGSGSFDCTYADGPNTHNPTVTVSDGDGGSDCDSLAVTVNNVAPSIAISGSANVDEGSLYTLNLGAVSDPGTDTVTELRRPLGRRQLRHLQLERRHEPHLRRRARRPRDHGRPRRRGRHLPDAANEHSVHVDNVAPSTPNLLSPADNSTTGDNTPAFDWSDSTDPAGANDTITYRSRSTTTATSPARRGTRPRPRPTSRPPSPLRMARTAGV